jgi:ABC-type Fe3+/spermidine/putrescine transport system ATPase subunit
MTPKMQLAPDDPHVSWAPERTQKTGVAASVRSISKRFKKTPVLDDVSFDVAEGESLVLLGASGSGKTTILRIIAGLEQPDTGSVTLHGKDVTDLPARERGVGVIFQSYALFPRMNGREKHRFWVEDSSSPPEGTTRNRRSLNQAGSA